MHKQPGAVGDQADPAPFALVNGRLALPDRIVEDQALIVAAGKIAGFAPVAALDPALPRCDAGGRLVTPGLVDIHIHGQRGHTFNEPTTPRFATISCWRSTASPACWRRPPPTRWRT